MKMKFDYRKQIEVFITLNEEEAMMLKDYMQNAFLSPEPNEVNLLRQKLFNGITTALGTARQQKG
jgi:hypothetical protein